MGQRTPAPLSRRLIRFRSLPRPDATVPTALFDSVIDNLLQNALEKRKRRPGVEILVQMMEGGRSLTVSDTGVARA